MRDNMRFGKNVKKFLYEGVILTTVLYDVETCRHEKCCEKKVIVLGRKCLKEFSRCDTNKQSCK